MKLVHVLSASLLLTGAARAGDESLLPLRTWTTNLWVVELAAADFDGNGRQEVVAYSTTEGPTTMDVYSLGPHGDILQHTTQPTNAYGDNAAADFDGDGLQDLAVANSPSTVVVYRGSPDGVPVLWKTIVTGGTGYGGVAIADVDDDTWPDILVSDPAVTSTKPLRLLRNTAGTGFQVLTAASATGWNLEDIDLADLNADGKLDVVASERSLDQVRVLLAQPAGTTFASVGTHAVADEPKDIHALDLTADGLMDVAVAVAGSTRGVSCLAGTGGGGLGPASTTPGDGGWGFMDSGDIDGDGDADLVLGTNESYTWGYANSGALPLAAPQTIRTIFNSPIVKMADANGDGWRDLVVGGASGANLSLSYGGPQGLQATSTWPLVSSPITLQAGDVTGDGLADVLALGGSSGKSLGLADGHGDGTFGAPVVTPLLGLVTGRQATIGLCNGDALPDVVVLSSGSGGGTHVRLAVGQGASKTFVLGGQANDAAGPAAGPLAADLDGDGATEICVPTSAGAVRVWHVDASNGLAAVGTFPVPDAATSFPAWNRSVAGDLDEDGFLDLVFPVSSLQKVFVLPGQAGGGLGAATVLDTAPGTFANCAYAVDVDEDGLNDVLGTGSGSTITLWRGQPGMAFDAPQTAAGGAPTTQCGDIDADGHLDLVGTSKTYQDYQPSTVVVARGLGNGQFLPPIEFASTGMRLALADFTSDGVLDVVTSGLVNGPGYPADGDRVCLYVTRPYTQFTDLGFGLGGSHGVPEFLAWGWLKPGQLGQLSVARAAPAAPAALFVGLQQLLAPFKGGTLVPAADIFLPGFVTDAQGRIEVGMTWPGGVPAGLEVVMQWWFADGTGPKGFTASNALTAVVP